MSLEADVRPGERIAPRRPPAFQAECRWNQARCLGMAEMGPKLRKRCDQGDESGESDWRVSHVRPQTGVTETISGQRDLLEK